MTPDRGVGASLSVKKGAAFTVAARWIDRSIGLASTVLLARLLAPDDFGVVALASVAIGFADVLLDLDVNVALIQNREATQKHYDTAWTLRLIQTSATTLALVFAAPFIASYFQEPRLENVVRALGFLPLLAGLENIGIVTFQKHMQFGAELRFLVLKRISGFVATIVAAFVLRSYWALVIGALSGRAIGAVLSYWVHPLRPRLSLAMFREIFGVSQWMLVRSVGTFLYNNLHKMIVGRSSSASVMGAFSLADDISLMPANELLAPLSRVLFPAFAAAKNDPAELKRLFLLAHGVQALLAIPATVGLASVASELVQVALGDKWLAAIPLLQVLAIANVTHALMTAGGYVLLAMNKVALSTVNTWVEVLVFASIALPFFMHSDAQYIALLRLATAGIGVSLSFTFVLRTLSGLRISELLANTIRPVLAAAVMSAVVYAVGQLPFPLAIAALIAKVVVGAITFVAAELLLWMAMGRPAGAESYVLSMGSNFWRTLPFAAAKTSNLN